MSFDRLFGREKSKSELKTTKKPPSELPVGDTLSRFLPDLRSKSHEVRAKAARDLRIYVESEAREMPPETFTKYMEDMTRRIFDLVNSPDPNEKMGGIMVIDELLDVAEAQIIRFANYLRMVFQQAGDSTDHLLLKTASKALGHLTRNGGTLAAETVEFELRRSLEWLEGDRSESRRYAAVLVLKELAENSPGLFNTYIGTFLDHIWATIRDAKLPIREASIEALRQCLTVIGSRSTRLRSELYQKIYQEVLQSFKINTTEAIHGALLAIGEMLRNNIEFMLARFKEVCISVLKFKSHSNRLVRETVIALLPKLAHFESEAFVRLSLEDSLQHIIATLKSSSSTRGTAYIALGEMALAVKDHIAPRLDECMELVKEGLSNRRNKAFANDALQCVSMLARAVGPKLVPHMGDLVDQMFSSGLSPTLVDALRELSTHVPSVLAAIQNRLLTAITGILTPAQSMKTDVRRQVGGVESKEDATMAILMALALDTLGTFNFPARDLLPFVKEVLTYLDHEQPQIRKQAAITLARLLLRQEESVDELDEKKGRTPVMSATVSEVLERLLTVGIADPDHEIRLAVLQSLDIRFDEYLGEAENLNSCFVALHDEVFGIREAAMAVIGRLAVRNPSYVMASLRKTLIQLLTELQYSSDTRSREESAKLLGHLITTAQHLIKPYVGAILDVLVPQLKGSDPSVASSVLATLGQLATIGGEDLLPHLDQLIPLIITTLQDKSSMVKRGVALRTLGELVSSTGSVIEPYLKYPQLLPTLLNTLKSGYSYIIRKEAMKVLGVLGALDPYQFKMNQREIALETSVTSNDSKGDNALALTPGVEKSSQDYFSAVAINALMRILREPGLSQHHKQAIPAVMYIVQSLGQKCVPFLPQIIPTFLYVMRNNEESVRNALFQQLGVLATIVKQSISPYLGDIFEMIHEYWNDSSLLSDQILGLVEVVASALKDDFKVYVADMIPQLLSILLYDRSAERLPTLKVLHTLKTLAPVLHDYFHLVVPVVIRLPESLDCPVNVQRMSMLTVGELCSKIDFGDYASRIIHPLARLLEKESRDPSGSAKFSASSQALRESVLHTLCVLVHQLGEAYAIFIPMMAKVFQRQNIQYERYERLVSKILSNQPLAQNDLGLAAPPPAPGGGPSGFSSDEKLDESDAGAKKLSVSQPNLKKCWEASQRATKEDWIEWMRGFSIELLKESPSPAMRACSMLAQIYHPLAQELFNAAFVSCWTELYDQYQDDLVNNLEIAFKAPNMPPELLQTLLNLAEFMEHDGKALPISISELGKLATSCHAYAKALHYKEKEFRTSPNTTIKALISINNHLGQPEAAVGILTYAEEQHQIELQESWYEKLQRWEDALEAYERKQLDNPLDPDAALGRMRCLRALGQWHRLALLSNEFWEKGDEEPSSRSKVRRFDEEPTIRSKIAPLAAEAAWDLGQWDRMPALLEWMEEDRIESPFFKALYAVHRSEFDAARRFVEQARARLDAELTAVVGESYNRAYRAIVKVQQLEELEEIIIYKQCDDLERKRLTRKMWASRLDGSAREVDVWQQILAVRSVVIRPKDDIPTWLKFSALCRKSGRLAQSLTILTTLMGDDPMKPTRKIITSDSPGLSTGASQLDISTYQPQVSFAYLKHLWAAGFRQEALEHLRTLRVVIEKEDEKKAPMISSPYARTHISSLDIKQISDGPEPMGKAELRELKANCYLKLGQWALALQGDSLDDKVIPDVLSHFENATKCSDTYVVWHNWAVMNYQAINHYESQKTQAKEAKSKRIDEKKLDESINVHVVPAIEGFFRSITFAGDQSLQDILRLLTLWFAHGSKKPVERALSKGFNTITVDTWLSVLPQIIARINTKQTAVRKIIHELLTNLGRAHPQALVYPLTVASKSNNTARKTAAIEIMDNMKTHSSNLVKEALMVSRELIRVAILWNEMWHEALEEASRLYFGQQNVEGMFQTLQPLHEMMEEGPETLREVAFVHSYGRDLLEAREWCIKYNSSQKDSDLNQAWDLYCNVFRKINKQLSQISNLELQYVSPKLLSARDLELAVPGTYLTESNKPVTQPVRIALFVPSLKVIESKQRPRKIGVMGSDGAEYGFLLKGHEDLRQDKRVMQLFGLVNTLLINDAATSHKDLSIRGYSVIPLAPNSGLIQWLENCDTLHALIKEYRDARKVLLNIEHRLMLLMAPDYQMLTLMQKVEVFEHALSRTTGQDLNKVLWLKSQNSEQWLDRRTNYTRSLAVMSMVGYILGLGDRHPCNLMLDRGSGKIIHIDFGDCFEVAMDREKFPEKIPFRLTRMLITAMEVSGIEGNFRSTCERVMHVLRAHKESVMAVLEAFVYDPLINWRLLQGGKTAMHGEPDDTGRVRQAQIMMDDDIIARSIKTGGLTSSAIPHRSKSDAKQVAPIDVDGEGGDTEGLNSKALKVLDRVQKKLTGKDFGKDTLDVTTQVEKLIREATSHENLCQCYIGWCPFW